ncbi:hypothetical protein KCU79_g1728, partial [Aureobasidium melanogenum]
MQTFADIFILSSTARIILRVYFIAALTLVCLLGDRCLHLHAKIRLLRGEDVNVASMLGWLRGFGPILTTTRLRTMPGGWMGSLMILTGLISLGCDLFTNLVVTVEMPRDCEFQTGILISDVNSGYNPSPYGAAALYTQAAQLSQVSLGDQTGDQGIYRAFDPTKLDIFFPSDNDVIGSWICKTSSPVVPFYNKSDEAIAEELRSSGYLYSDFKPFALSNLDIQLVILSANSTIWGQPWDLKVAVDMKNDNEGISKQMQVQTCTLETTLSWVNNIRNKINIAPMMSSWAPFFSSNLFESFNSDQPDGGADSVSQTLEILQNSIIMVAGTQNAINIASGGLRYGCLLPGARFPYGVIALVFLVCSLVLFFMVYLLYLQIQLLRTERQYDQSNANQFVSSSELCDSVPNSTLDWIAHAAHQSDNSETRPKHHHVRDWLVSSRSHNGPRISLVRRHGSVHNTPMSVYSQSGFSPQTNTFFSQKTGYDAVQTSEAYIPNA